MVLGIVLCCLKAARGHFLRRPHFQRTLERKIRERMERNQSNIESPPYIWDRDYSMPSQPSPTWQIRSRTLHGGRFPTLTYSQEDLHRNLRENITRQTSRLGSRRLPGFGRNSPAHHPLGTAHRLPWGPNCKYHLQQQHQGTRPHRASSIIALTNPAPATDTCKETQRRIPWGWARLLRADVDIWSIRKSTSQLYSST